MELRHLRYFTVVAEELHFRRAAERLFMAQPPLSHQIRQLEKEIGVQLFERTNRRVKLTAAGEVFLAETRDILARIPTAVEKTQRASRGETGWFGVGFVASATYDVLPVILRRFREQYVDVELVLLEIPGVEQWQALREKRIHVGFGRLQSREKGIVIESVAQDTLVVALPANHRLSDKSAIRLAELEKEPFILYPHQPESSYAEHIIHLCEMAGFSPRVVQKTGEIQTAVSLVEAGIGVAIVPAAAHNLRRDGVAYVPIADPAPTIELSMGYRQGDSSPILPHFLRIVRETVRHD